MVTRRVEESFKSNDWFTQFVYRLFSANGLRASGISTPCTRCELQYRPGRGEVDAEVLMDDGTIAHRRRGNALSS
jgi:hypothetical protein